MIYNQDFIKPEMIDGWFVDEKTKKVWAIQLDLLQQLDGICRKYNLRWYPDGGTLLGAVRHRGFIPWDDDVDVCMPREDYNKLMMLAPQELEYPYELQTPLNDEDCYMFWISLRNSETTGNRASCLKKRLNNGIGIDIIPMEGCENNYLLYKLRRMPLKLSSVICNTYVNEWNNSKKAIMLRRFLRLFTIDYKKIYKWHEKKNTNHPMGKYSKCTQTLAADPMFRGWNGLRKVIFDKEYYSETIQMPFEYIDIPVPKGYDSILKQYYGDYMQFPSLEERKPKHDVIWEPDIPYKEYCEKNYGVKY